MILTAIDEKLMELKLRQYIRDCGFDRSGQCIPNADGLHIVGQRIRKEESSSEIVQYLLNLASAACKVRYHFESREEYRARLRR